MLAGMPAPSPAAATIPCASATGRRRPHQRSYGGWHPLWRRPALFTVRLWRRFGYGRYPALRLGRPSGGETGSAATVYVSHLDMDIRRRADNASLLRPCQGALWTDDVMLISSKQCSPASRPFGRDIKITVRHENARARLARWDGRPSGSLAGLFHLFGTGEKRGLVSPFQLAG